MASTGLASVTSAPKLPLSARGVPGEAKFFDLKQTIREHGGQVPYYNGKGFHHHRVPHKDKSGFAGVPVHPEWTQTPRHKTQSELFSSRRAAKHPDISYDVDGDGAVGPTDYFISKNFGRERDHHLNTPERGQVVQALERGWLDNFSFGHDASGPRPPGFHYTQRRGRIINPDSANDLAHVYPPHWNAHKKTDHSTLAELQLDRKQAKRNENNTLKDQWDAANPDFVPEPPVTQEFMVERPSKTNINQRTAVFRSESREVSGLDLTNTAVNPERESLTIGLEYRERPEFATSTSLREARRAQLTAELVDLRVRGEAEYIPERVRHSLRDSAEYDFRRPHPDSTTLTKLKDQRRQDLIKHNLENFTAIPPEPPRFSDQDDPWWKMRAGYCPEPPDCLLRELRDPPKQVTGKVTETLFSSPAKDAEDLSVEANGGEVVAAAGLGVEVHSMPDGARKFKRWSQEFIPPTLQTQVPRLFAGIKQAPTLSTDSRPLHQLSSFKAIRDSGVCADTDRQRETALEDDERALAWRRFVKHGPIFSHQRDSYSDSMGGGTIDMGSNQITRRIQVPKMVPVPMAVGEISGDEVPMLERLDRLNATQRPPLPRESLLLRGGDVSPSASEPTRTGGHREGQRKAASTYSVSSTPVEKPPGHLSVRSGGFQWLDKVSETRPRLVEDLSSYSLRPTPSESVHNRSRSQSQQGR